MDKKDNAGLLKDVYEDLQEFKDTKESVNELLRMRRTLSEHDSSDLEKINEIRGKAMEAINHLFSDDHDQNKK